MVISRTHTVHAALTTLAALCWSLAPCERVAAAEGNAASASNWDKREWGTPVKGVVLSLITSAERVPPGDPIVVGVATRNVGKEVATLTQTNILLRDYRLKVIGPDGKESLTEYGKRSAASRWEGSLLICWDQAKKTWATLIWGGCSTSPWTESTRYSVERMVDDPDWLHVTPASAKIEITVDESLLYAKPEKR